MILLDTANLDEICNAIDLYPIDGVTTNPTILVKEKKDFLKHIKDIRSLIGNERMLHVQVVGTKYQDIIDEAYYLNENIGGNVYIKIPVLPEGIKAMKYLSEKNIKVTATAVFTSQQALIAAKAGAKFVAPYINRIDNISSSGIDVVGEIAKIYKMFSLDTKILAASFKNVDQVKKAFLAGSDIVTISYDILEHMVYHPSTIESVNQFIKDWKELYGDTKTNSH
ncbi:fructose-6-phosphate aldolase [Thermoanaerobacterium thermosaccharolyticum]|jgi:fructose-6-phosphate aldolase 2|uniref:fructose-6-phosphate aldolase n=1 Tax=Thermoanaerobacterium thermosaccharolyticum TaxID=1517 RepID=UPI0020A37454|nr:fructose-6-phosphate aldolase [Thermoanaerobacterium thermosaccharolyticum]MCP2238908.1 fructose-6-phosphate aldolase 2 [Thermoanaerobacterium thermosaccharolyticum]